MIYYLYLLFLNLLYVEMVDKEIICYKYLENKKDKKK